MFDGKCHQMCARDAHVVLIHYFNQGQNCARLIRAKAPPWVVSLHSSQLTSIGFQFFGGILIAFTTFSFYLG